ncbi:MAG: DUF4416 family protein [Thermoguttaceae bacterium]
MGEIREKMPVLPIIAAFASDEQVLAQGLEYAKNVFGPLKYESEIFRFDKFTSYYASSMGEVLYKRIWAFEKLISPETLAQAKIETNNWEEQYAKIDKENGSATVERPLNLDPGYIDLGKLVLASTKDHAHRIYLGSGIFGEVTLIYTKKSWQPLPWTYPDYQTAEYHAFFDKCRDYLHDELKRLA